MVCGKKERGALLFLVLLALMSAASAQSLEVSDISVSPSVVWLNDDSRITVSAKCMYNSSSIEVNSARVDIRSPGGLTTTENLRYSGGVYSSAFLFYGFSEVGTYTASVTCEYNGASKSGSKIFSVRNMELSIVTDGSEIDAYIGETLELKLDFRVDGASVALAKDDYRIKIDDIEMDVVSVIGMSGYQKIGVDLCPDGDIEDCMDDLPEGTYDLEVTAYYSSGKSLTAKEDNYVRVNPPLKIEFSQDELECSVGQACSPDVSFSVEDTSSDASDLTKKDVSARILGNKVFESVYVSDLKCDSSGDCVVKLNVPANLQPGTYDLFIAVEKDLGGDSYTVEEPITLQVVLLLSGSMTDAAGEVVNSAFTLTNLKNGQVVSASTGSSGEYSMAILPGEYTLEARLRGSMVKFNNVSISSSDFLLGLMGNPIRYDEGHLNSEGPQGARVIKTIAVELALPFSSAWFYVPYDSAQVNGDENNLRVYKCGNWNFEKGICSGSWLEVKADVHTIRNAVEFRSDSTSAFVIGEQRALHMQNVELESSEVYVGQNVVVNGKVMDSDGHPVEGAQLKLSFPAFGITSSGESTTGGFFKATITAPYTTGYPDLVIEASKSSYMPSSTTTTLDVKMKRELSVVNLPESAEVSLGVPKTIRFRVFNSGQLNLSKMIAVRVTGIPESWYTLSESKVDYLDVSEQREIELRITVSPQMCGAGCDKFYLEASDAASFNLMVVSPQNQTASSDQGGFDFPSLTGFSISLPAVKNPYLPLTLIVILLVLIVNKRKAEGVLSKGRSRRGGKGAPKLRDSVMASLSNIKREL